MSETEKEQEKDFFDRMFAAAAPRILRFLMAIAIPCIVALGAAYMAYVDLKTRAVRTEEKLTQVLEENADRDKATTARLKDWGDWRGDTNLLLAKHETMVVDANNRLIFLEQRRR